MTTKADHYFSQLNAALCAGQWTSNGPVKTPKGNPISWSELFRKFKKHCPAHRELGNVAYNTHALALLHMREGGKSNGDLDSDWSDLSRPLEVTTQCTLLEERLKEAKELVSTLKGSEKSSESRRHFIAWATYSQGKSGESLKQLIELEETIDSTVATVPPPSATSLSPPSTLSTTTGTIYALSLTRTKSISRTPTVVIPQIHYGQLWETTERVRSLCLKGMSYEKSKNYEEALKSYLRALPLISNAQPPLTSVSSPISSATSVPPETTLNFSSAREFWRWSERLMFRAIIISARTSPVTYSSNASSFLSLLRQYRSYATHWPHAFRPYCRAVVFSIHLRVLIVLAKDSTPVTQSYALEIQQVAEESRNLLGAVTKFPRAGRRNELVEDFIDLCVAAWDVQGSRHDQCGWVIDTLWWGTNLTFNSPRIYRHLARLLYAIEEYDLSKRAIAMYVEVVSKERQSGDIVNPETDTQWIETLVEGARMLCRTEGCTSKDMQNALGYLVQARAAVMVDDAVHNAAINLAEGIVVSVQAYVEENPNLRELRLLNAIEFLEKANSLHPTASSNYHLALALSRPTPARDIVRAIDHAQAAVELDPKEPRCWHLLSLLVMVHGDWRKAGRILECGISVMEELQSQWHHQPSVAPSEAHTVHTHDSHSQGAASTSVVLREPHPHRHTETPEISEPGPSDQVSGYFVLPASASLVPPGETLLPPLKDHAIPSPRQQFEYALQLRLTQIALIEHSEGPESAAARYLEVFAWFGDNKGHVMASGWVDDAKPSDTQSMATSMPISPMPEEEEDRRSVRSSSSHPKETSPKRRLHKERPGSPGSDSRKSSELHSPAPIKVTPATPLDEVEPRRLMEGSYSGSMREHSSHRHIPSIVVDGFPKVEHRNSKDSKDSGREDKEHSKGKKVHQMQQLLRSQVHKGREGIRTVQKKISQGAVRRSSTRRGQKRFGLRRTNSAPDFHAVLAQTRLYQASSIHSRGKNGNGTAESKQLKSWGQHLTAHPPSPIMFSPPGSPIPMTAPMPMAPSPTFTRPLSGAYGDIDEDEESEAMKWHRSLLSHLWTSAAATFRRCATAGEGDGDKMDETRSAIQEAESLNVGNVDVWVQYGIYLLAIGDATTAIESFNKALFIDPEYVPAVVHLCGLYLEPPPSLASARTGSLPSSQQNSTSGANSKQPIPTQDEISLAMGMLTKASLYRGWDVPEVWYLLAKAHRLQHIHQQTMAHTRKRDITTSNSGSNSSSDEKGKFKAGDNVVLGGGKKERECLQYALMLAQAAGVRDARTAVGLCL